MGRSHFWIGTAALLLGVVILVFAEGLRRYYSGLFFVVLGLVLLLRGRWAQNAGTSG